MVFLKDTFKGRTIYRYLLHKAMKRFGGALKGDVLDLASGPSPSYHEYIPSVEGLRLHTADLINKTGIQSVVDFNAPLPWNDDAFDGLLFVNALYIVDDPNSLLREMKRIVKSSGTIFIISPFVANEMPEPHDYVRYTHEGLTRLFVANGWQEINIQRLGDRGTSATYILNPFLKFFPFRIIGHLLGLFVDALVPRRVKRNHPVPLGYFCIIKNTKEA